MKKPIVILFTLVLIITLVSCSAGTISLSGVTGVEQDATGTASVGATTTNDSSQTVSSSTSQSGTQAVPISDKPATHESSEDYTYDSEDATTIEFSGNSITVDGAGAKTDGSTVTINEAGTFLINGSLTDGQIIVNTVSDNTVKLVLNGVIIYNSSSAPIYVEKAEKVILILADGTQNSITDGELYVFASADVDEPNAAIYSKADLSISGNGSLTVNGNYQDGITSKDGLIIASGTIVVNAADDGIRGKDYLVVENGLITVNAKGDGLKSDNEEDLTVGYISILAGTFKINADGDAITASNDVSIVTGEFTLTTGSGSGYIATSGTSSKGIKGSVAVEIQGGSFNIDSSDDSIHSNDRIIINGGLFLLSSADDGIHADNSLTINGGKIQIDQSYEGIESAVITINAGEVWITASDDGLNVAGGNDNSGMNNGMGMGQPGGKPGRGGAVAAPGQDSFNYTGSYYLYMNGGYLYVDAGGDGVDVNGAIEMTGGAVIVNGPTEQMNGALDYDAGFKLSAGYVVAVGSAGMAMVPDSSSTQNSVLIYLDSTQPAGTLFHIENSAGEDILTFVSTKTYQSIAFSSAELLLGETYTLYVGGSSSGTSVDGLYQGGTYTAGNSQGSFTISSSVTTVGSGGRMGPGARN